ncbi:Transcription factor bHLH146 [Hirschfeldia incana]|nr:Transcription factor bHLH146 [Hirschfeldia incana]
MERQIISKKKRVFSTEPAKLSPSEVFTRKYTSHLVPALKKLNMDKNSPQINQLTVKHEVDMALALSAQEFAWSRFLLEKLSSSNNPTTTISSSSDGTRTPERSCKEDEDGEIEEKLRELQKLLPGGEEMNVEEMLSEIGNYIKCLELQTSALKSIVQDTT